MPVALHKGIKLLERKGGCYTVPNHVKTSIHSFSFIKSFRFCSNRKHVGDEKVDQEPDDTAMVGEENGEDESEGDTESYGNDNYNDKYGHTELEVEEDSLTELYESN